MRLLNPFEVVFSGINLVEASAGTGKTYNITSLYIRALIERDIPVGKILVVTYTEAATKELKDRLLRRIRQSAAVLKSGKAGDESDQFLKGLLEEVEDYEMAAARLDHAIRTFDEASVYTIHGFCYQVLQEQAFESRAMYGAEMIGDDSELVQEAVDDYWRNWVAEASGDPQKQLLLTLLTDNRLGPETLARELESYIGKPYLHILPEKNDGSHIERQVPILQDIYSVLQELWREQREKIFEILDRGHLSYYTGNKLKKWFGLMDEFLETEAPPLALFTQFYRFQQSEINTSLKKRAKEQGTAPPQLDFFQLADEYRNVLESVKEFEIVFRKDLLYYLRDELYERKEETQVLSYDDLLLRLHAALLAPRRGKRLSARIREKYPVAMVDEFQDTDPIQYDIFRRIYRDFDHTVLFMIGDPKQSIYSFRGADVYSYIEAREDASEDKRYRLDRNFRSTPDMLRGLNILWGRREHPFAVDEIEYQQMIWGRSEESYDKLTVRGKECPPIRFHRLSEVGQGRLKKGEAKGEVARDTAREIRRLLEGGRKGEIAIGGEPVQAKDIAVLVRKHAQAGLISDALREQGIKSVQYSDISVFRSDEAGQLEQLLKALAEPANQTLVKTALSQPLTGYTADALFAIEKDEERWIHLLGQFAGWHRKWREQGFAAMFRSLMSELRVSEQLIRYPDGERRLTNILHLGELLQEESQRREGTRSLLHWLARKRGKQGVIERDEEQMRLESDEDLIKIVTMHKSKGLQYPIVFCPFLWFGPDIADRGQPLKYHHPADNRTAYLDLNGKLDPKRAEKRFFARKEELSESMRLAYVAMTRAEYALYLTWECASASEFSSLGFLLQGSARTEALLGAKLGYGDNVADWSGDEIHHAIGRLCSENTDLFTLNGKREPPQGAQLELPAVDVVADDDEEEDDGRTFHARRFTRSRPLETSYRVSSFSALSSWMDDDPDRPVMPDYDQFLLSNSDEAEPPGDGKKTIFNFPKGPLPGTCIHHIFEKVSFSSPADAGGEVLRSLTTHGIDPGWREVTMQMLETVVHKPLLPVDGGRPVDGELTLSSLEPSDLIQEMEFYFSNETVRTQELMKIIRNGSSRVRGMGGKAGAGFMKGFIDLTFQHEGRFYLLDYKTNYLGRSPGDYDQSSLRHEMRDAFYDLQYHIYTVALHRFLAGKLPGYSYDKHFGGAFYLFLRGINAEGREGIFYHRPEFKTIGSLDRYLLEGERR